MDRGALEQLKAEVEAELDRRNRADQPTAPARALLALIEERQALSLAATVERRQAIAAERGASRANLMP